MSKTEFLDNSPESGDSREDQEYNRWPTDVSAMYSVAAEACLSIVGITKQKHGDFFVNALIQSMNVLSGGSELGSIGPSIITEDNIPTGYELVAHPNYIVYVKQKTQPARRRGHVINDPGFFQVIVRSKETAWQHQFMHFDYWMHTRELYEEGIETHKVILAMRRDSE